MDLINALIIIVPPESFRNICFFHNSSVSFTFLPVLGMMVVVEVRVIIQDNDVMPSRRRRKERKIG